MASSAVLLLSLRVLAAFLQPVPVDASEFLERSGASTGRPVPRPAILEELDDVLGTSYRRATEARLGTIESFLRPVVAALPKNPQGGLNAPSARYALHRLFLQRHAWHVRGLHPEGGPWSGASPVSDMGNLMPEEIRSLFERRLNSTGFDLHELAVLAATMEHLVRDETEVRLSVAYQAMDHEAGDAPLSEEEAAGVIEAYVASYSIVDNLSTLTPEIVRKRLTPGLIEKWILTWPETKKFVRQVQQDVAPRQYDFRGVRLVVESVDERYGQWQSAGCLTLKDKLVELEDKTGTGRVRLLDFYGGALHNGHWEFRESVQYLREIGALDESDPAALRVIIPNYLHSPSNCIGSSNYYSICCVDECEELFGHLERQIGAPSATPQEITALISSLPSATVPGNRTLPDELLRRLDEVARHHGGRVPLHGRLFAQWMHHAYPQECPFPHLSGTTSTRPAGHTVTTASREEMEQHLEAALGSGRRPAVPAADEGICSVMWTAEEELVDPHAHAGLAADGTGAAAGDSKGSAPIAVVRMVFRSIALLGVAGSTALGFVRLPRPLLAAHPGTGKPVPLLLQDDVRHV